MNTFSKQERLCSRTAIDRLLREGKYGSVPGLLRFCFVAREEEGPSRLLISVPKKNFKRAVRRNFIKRRIREGYRTRKTLLPADRPADLMLIYTSKEIPDQATLSEAVASALREIASRLPKAAEKNE